uniref:Uncharacterized protein n=1 Tax=Amphimedon queenslandica TaxID=400682 RepID=A0A1X7UKA7_AMPQE
MKGTFLFLNTCIFTCDGVTRNIKADVIAWVFTLHGFDVSTWFTGIYRFNDLGIRCNLYLTAESTSFQLHACFTLHLHSNNIIGPLAAAEWSSEAPWGSGEGLAATGGGPQLLVEDSNQQWRTTSHWWWTPVSGAGPPAIGTGPPATGEAPPAIGAGPPATGGGPPASAARPPSISGCGGVGGGGGGGKPTSLRSQVSVRWWWRLSSYWCLRRRRRRNSMMLIIVHKL